MSEDFGSSVGALLAALALILGFVIAWLLFDD
jgi:hypothetical protein